MIQLYIDGKLTALPVDCSFDLLLENPYFTNNSESTYDIEIDMRCQQNQNALGVINRMDITHKRIRYKAEIRENNQTLIAGEAVVISITDEIVSIQILANNSLRNYILRDDICIDELKLPTVNGGTTILGSISYNSYKNYIYGSDYAAFLPICVGEKTLNKVYYTEDNKTVFLDPVSQNYPQLRFTAALTAICEAMGLTIYENDIETTSAARYAYIANTVRTQVMNDLLPHWTVNKFFDEIEKMFSVVTEIKDNKYISFISKGAYYMKDTIVVEDENILDEFEVEITDEISKKDTTVNVEYDLLSSIDANKLYSFDESFLEDMDKRTYNSYQELRDSWWSMYEDVAKKYIFIDKSTNKEYIQFNLDSYNPYLIEVNTFRPRINDKKNENTVKLSIVPVAMQPVNVGISGSRQERVKDMVLYMPFTVENVAQKNEYDSMQQKIISGEGHKALNKKNVMELFYNVGLETVELPEPHDVVIMYTDEDQCADFGSHPSDRLGSFALDGRKDSIGQNLDQTPKFNSHIKYKIKFRTQKRIKDVSHPFLIHNQKYACEQLQVSVSASGVSNVYEGIFFKFKESL